jgi:outer membrane receptor for ferrienterochelin and colicins
MRRIFTFIVLSFFSICTNAQYQSSNTIYGDVTSDGTSLPFINVYVSGTTIGTTTDNNGQFTLNQIPEGKITVVAQGVGFKAKSVVLENASPEPIEVNFQLEEDVLNLEGVVVTADRNATSRLEAPVIVNALTPKLFESTQAINVADVLDLTPGLRMECNCSNCGFTQVRMNGMDGSYSQILMNSRPVFSGLAGVYGLELIPTNMIERVEVVRCGGSALFGGNAIAGTVNIITQDPVNNGFSIDTRYGVIGIGNEEGTTPANDFVLTANGSMVTEDRKAGMFLYGLSRKRDSFDENGDDFSEMVEMNNLTVGLSGFIKPSNRTKLTLDLYRIEEFRRGGNMLDYLPHEADIAEMVEHSISGINLSFDLFTNAKKLDRLTFYAAGQGVDRSSYYGAQQDPDAYGATNDLTTSIGGQYFWDLEGLGSLILGVDNNSNRLEDTKLASNGNPNETIVDQFVNTLGSFAQFDLLLDNVKFSMGLRHDNYLIRDLEKDPDQRQDDVAGNVFAPRATILWDIAPTIQFRMGYAKGYRAPQIFDEDLHIEASASKRIIHVNSSGLKQETSHSLSSSFTFINNIGGTMTEFLAEAFYTKLIDPFAYEYHSADSNYTYTQVRKNAEDGAFVTGINLEFKAAFPKLVSLSTGFTFQKSLYDSPQLWGEGEESVSREFMRSPSSYGYLNVDWRFTKKITASLNSTYTGSMLVPHLGLSPISDREMELINNGQMGHIDEERQHEVETILRGDVIGGERLERSEQFLIFGLRVAYDFTLSDEMKLQVYGGVQNIFNQSQKYHDRGVYRDAGYIYGPCRPRTINLGIKIGNLF